MPGSVILFFIMYGWMDFMVGELSRPFSKGQPLQDESNWVWIYLKSKPGKKDDPEFNERVKNFLNTHHCKDMIETEAFLPRQYITSILYEKKER